MNSAVSSPSRPTASSAASPTAVAPRSTACCILPCRSSLIVCEARRIQKTIQVTNPTAMIDRMPPKASWASKLMFADV